MPTAPTTPPPTGHRVRLSLDHALIAGIFLASLALYTTTMAGGITWSNDGGDGGDFLTAAFNWGVPHPTGYPTYVVLLRLFSWAVPIGEPALRANLFSAVAAAGAVPLVYLIARHVAVRMPEAMSLGAPMIRLTAVFTALAFAGSSVFWSQATITEVYALNALFAAALVLLAVTVRTRIDLGHDARYWLAALAFLAGLGLGNHVTLGLVVVPAGIWATWPVLWHIRRNVTLVPVTGGVFALGLLIYLYPPIASSQGPVLAWGHPHTLEGFRWMATASLYQNYAFGIGGDDLPGRVIKVFDFLLGQFGVVAVILGVGGIATLWSRWRSFAIATMIAAAGVTAYAVGYSPNDSYVYLIPMFMIFAVWTAAGAMSLISAVKELSATRFRARLGSRSKLVVPALFALLVAAGPASIIPLRFEEMYIRDDRRATDYVEEAVKTAGPHSVILADGVELFSLWYHAYVARPEDDILVVSTALLRFDWYWDDLYLHFPDRIPAARPSGDRERITQIADFNEGTAGVYLTHADKFYSSSFQLAPAGNLHLVTGRSPGVN